MSGDETRPGRSRSRFTPQAVIDRRAPHLNRPRMATSKSGAERARGFPVADGRLDRATPLTLRKINVVTTLIGAGHLAAPHSIDAAASDRRRAETTDPSKTRTPPAPPAPTFSVGTDREASQKNTPAGQDISSGGAFMRAGTANEIRKAEERFLTVPKLKGDPVDRHRATALVFRLAREERDAWVTWPARVTALMAAAMGTETSANETALWQGARTRGIGPPWARSERSLARRPRHSMTEPME